MCSFAALTAKNLLIWYSEKYLQVTTAFHDLYYSAMIHDVSILHMLQETLSAGKPVAQYSPCAPADYRPAQPWTAEEWPRIRDEIQSIMQQFNRAPTGEKQLFGLVPSLTDDFPAMSSAPNTHTPCTLLMAIHRKLLTGDGWSKLKSKRPPIKISTSFRPCLGCALFVSCCSRLLPALLSSKVSFWFPLPDVKDTSPWFMPEVEDSEHRELLVQIFTSACKAQVSMWALTKEYAEAERR